MQVQTPRRFIAFTQSKVFGRLIRRIARWDLNAGIVEGHVEPAENFDCVNAINLRGVWTCMKLRQMHSPCLDAW